MFYRLLFSVVLGLSVLHTQAQVWSTDVAPILYNNCVSCHRTGGIAPFSLLTYTEAFNGGGAISSAVTARRMPPWPPDPSYRRLAHERLLTQQEINTIVSWVNNGKPEGDPTLAPPQPVFGNADLSGTPDLISRILTYSSQAASGDIYRCFVIPSGITAERFITAFEAIPGNRSIVHHVLVFSDTTGICASLDALDPNPGYTSFGGPGHNDAKLLGGWVPGTSPLVFPAGFGVRLAPNADIVVQIHYPAGSQGMTDSTEIHFFFSPTNNVRNAFIEPVLNHGSTLINGPLVIPANQTRSFTAHYEAPLFSHFSVLGVAPHMHLIGRNIESFAVSPTHDTTHLIRINDWNFHWQGFYMFPRIQKITAGSDLFATAFYDNTSNNPRNPNNPPQNVVAGEATTDEMMVVYFIYALYMPGDEQIVIDSTALTSVKEQPYYRGEQLLQIFPNPASDRLVVKTWLEQPAAGSIELLNMEGKLVRTLQVHSPMAEGYAARQFDISSIPSGLYYLRLRTGGQTRVEKLVIQH